MNSYSSLIRRLKTFVFVSSLLVFPEVALPDARVICADKIMEAGSKVRMRSAEVSALPNGLLRHSWSSGDIECDTIDDQIINLTINGNKILENGFSSAEAEVLFKYMQSENSKMLAECNARFNGTKETFANIYLPKLQSLDTDIEAIKKQFDENFSKVSREFYIKKYYEHQEPLARLETYEELLRNDATNSVDNQECITVADKALTRETDFRRRIESLEFEVAQRDETLSQQATEIAKLREELRKLEGIREGLSAELALYEKPRKLNAIIDTLKTADFAEANQFYEEISSKFNITAKERKRLEFIAIEKVRPIPASDISRNRAGYQFLVNLFPENRYYQNKLTSYSD
jgi:phage shock protein A